MLIAAIFAETASSNVRKKGSARVMAGCCGARPSRGISKRPHDIHLDPTPFDWTPTTSSSRARQLLCVDVSAYASWMMFDGIALVAVIPLSLSSIMSDHFRWRSNEHRKQVSHHSRLSDRHLPSLLHAIISIIASFLCQLKP